MNLKFELPDDTLITSRSDLKSLLRELKEELQEEKCKMIFLQLRKQLNI
ncbi:hypothetical protein LQK80_29980 [Bacillus thuringiensis]|nr:hypothetical protein [Bacillus thuringiensis]